MAALTDTLRQAGSSPEATVLGTALTAGGQIGAGIAQRRAGAFMGREADVAAGQEEAASQRAAYDQTRRANLVASRAQAIAAGSGGTATDPTVTDIIGRIAGEGAYRSQLALYQGSEAARALRTRGDIARFEGQQAQAAGITRGFATVLKGGATLLDKLAPPKSILTSSDYDPTGYYGMT